MQNSTREKPLFMQSYLDGNTESLRKNCRWTAYWQLLRARMREMRREPEVIFWIFIFPLLLAVGLGMAFRNKPLDTSRVVVAAESNSQRAASLLKTLAEDHALDVKVLLPERAENAFRLGKCDVVIEAQENGSFEYVYDPNRPESVFAREMVNAVLQTAAGRRDPLPTTTRFFPDPGSRYIDFLLPGLLGLNLMGSGMWGVGFALIEMRQRKLLKRYVATPMKRFDFLLALATSRVALMIVELLLLLGFGVLCFHLHVEGSWLAVFIVSLVGALSFAGVGLLSASRARKMETASGLVNLVMLPMWLFSGVFFSYERFPHVMHPAIKMMPLTALIDALRSIIIEGGSFAAQSNRLLVLLVWGGVSFVLALRWFRWT